MKRSLMLLLVVLLQAVSSLSPGHEGFHAGIEVARQPDPARIWRFSNTDGFVRGNFLLCRDGAVSIQRSAGGVVVIPLGQLSQADRDYAADRLGRIEWLNTRAPIRLVSLQAGGGGRLESPRPPLANFFQGFERNGKVRMDVCEDHGVWLDTGELESIVRRVRSKGRASADNKVSRARHQGKVSGMLWGPLSFLFD